MVSPDKFIRKAYSINLANIGCPIYDMVVPKSVIPVPDIYVLITTQTKSPYQTTKCGHEWDCSVLLDIVCHFDQGFYNRIVIDDIETNILTAIDTWTFNKTDISIPPFRVYNTEIGDSHDMSLDTPTKTIARKLLRFRHFMGVVNTFAS